jgi:hypothetical protein
VQLKDQESAQKDIKQSNEIKKLQQQHADSLQKTNNTNTTLLNELNDSLKARDDKFEKDF